MSLKRTGEWFWWFLLPAIFVLTAVLSISFVPDKAGVIIGSIVALLTYVYVLLTSRILNNTSQQVTEMRRQLSAVIGSAEFNVIQAIHEIMHQNQQDRLRLHQEGVDWLRKGLERIHHDLTSDIQEELAGPGMINRTRIPVSFKEMMKRAKAFLKENDAQNLTRYKDFQTGTSTNIQIFDKVLSSFDLIAVSVFAGNDAAFRIACAYRSAFEATSIILLPYVWINGTLRGEPDYKAHYLYLLSLLKIDLQGLSVSEETKKSAKPIPSILNEPLPDNKIVLI